MAKTNGEPMEDATKLMQEAARAAVQAAAKDGGPAFGVEFVTGFHAGYLTALRAAALIADKHAAGIKGTMQYRTEFGQDIAQAQIYGVMNAATLIRRAIPRELMTPEEVAATTPPDDPPGTFRIEIPLPRDEGR